MACLRLNSNHYITFHYARASVFLPRESLRSLDTSTVAVLPGSFRECVRGVCFFNAEMIDRRCELTPFNIYIVVLSVRRTSAPLKGSGSFAPL